jgi:hypothetical protein
MPGVPDILDQKAIAPPDVLFQETDGESVLLKIETGQYFGLDAIGTRMWEVSTTATSLRAACEILATEFDVEPQRLEEDLGNLVKNLMALGLMEVRVD